MPEPWTDAIDDDAVRAVVGDDTFRRGAEYARAGTWRPQLRRFRLPSVPTDDDAVDPPSSAEARRTV